MKKIITLILFMAIFGFSQMTATYRSVATCLGNTCYPATDRVPAYVSLVTYNDVGVMTITVGNTSNIIKFTNPRTYYNHGIEIIMSDMVDDSGTTGLYYYTIKGLMFFDGTNTLMIYDGNPADLYNYFNYIAH